jgi:imidazolonepropionase-like amidohydrolase
MRVSSFLISYAFQLLLLPGIYAQQAASLSPAVQKYVRVNTPRVVLQHVRVIDGTGRPPVEDQNLIIEQGKIASVQASSETPAADGTTFLDLHGYTVMPGIVGMHNHLFYIAEPNEDSQWNFEPPMLLPQMTFSAPRLYLAGGVTTMRTTGSVETYADLNLKRAIDEGKLPGPHIDVTGPYLEGPHSYFIQMHELSGPDEARQIVDYWADRGVTSFKAYMNITRAELKAAIEAAHKRGIKVTGHLCSVTYKEAAELGIDDLEHGFFVNTQLDPDKKPDECSSSMGDYFEAMAPEARDAYLYSRERPATMKPAETDWAMLFKHDLQMEYAFVAAGGLLLAGPDPTGSGGVVPGFGDQREIELLVEAGISPVQAIKIATLNGAIYLGKQDQFGSIIAGKNADLVIIKGDPTTTISDIEKVEIVFKDGVSYDSQKLIDSANGRYGQY